MMIANQLPPSYQQAHPSRQCKKIVFPDFHWQLGDTNPFCSVILCRWDFLTQQDLSYSFCMVWASAQIE